MIPEKQKYLKVNIESATDTEVYVQWVSIKSGNFTAVSGKSLAAEWYSHQNL